MRNIQHDFEQFMKQREKAASAYVNGDPSPIGDLATRDLPATFFGPGGGTVKGAHEVVGAYEHDSGMFRSGSKSRLEILQMAATDGVAYWTGLQHATVNMSGQPDPVPMTLRVTEIFRREDGDWKLVHRHADMLAERQKPKRK